MFTLLETIIAFTVIMMLLSFLVKSLTSVVKNHLDYYSGHLESEVRKLVLRLLGTRLEDVQFTSGGQTFRPFDGVDWKKMGEEFLTAGNIAALLGPLLTPSQIEALKAQVEIHKGKLKYLFARRMKNLSLACGLGLCLLVNINALTIWKTLYQDGQTRAKFAEPDYVEAVLLRADEAETVDEGEQQDEGEGDEQQGDEPGEEQQGEEQGAEGDQAARAAALAEEREMFRKELESFTSDVDFGIGRVYDTTVPLGPGGFLAELLGSLLTGVLVSIGAPYWHDLLRTLNRARSDVPDRG